MNITTPPSSPQSASPANESDIQPTFMAAAVFIAWLANFLFWKHEPGISLALFVCAVSGIVIALHHASWDNRRVLAAAILMVAAGWATALEISFTNTCVLAGLFAVICGECWYGELQNGWARWTESIVAWLAAPGRWPWLARRMNNVQPAVASFNARTGGTAARALQVVAPVVCLTAVFVVIFSFGNAVFSDYERRVAEHFRSGISRFDFSPGHIFFWLVSATFALAWTHPRQAPGGGRPWTRPLLRIAREDRAVAVWQARLTLAALNALFFIVNTIDVFYLWNNMRLPAGVTFSEFVHNGVWSLIIAVLLSAVVITVIFQHEASMTRGWFLKSCALFWIAQNLMLLAGVFLRLKLYVRAYQLSEERVYVGCFLALVAAGFVLLSLHVARDGNIHSLLFRNVAATFVLFFALQFANVSGWVAHYNVERWKREPQRGLDVGYLESLGPGAWPALVEAASSKDGSSGTAAQARTALSQLAAKELARLQTADWRSWQARRDRQSHWLIEESIKLPPPAPTQANQSDSQTVILSR